MTGSPALQSADILALLGRDQIEVDRSILREAVTGRTILITGAGGSIGAELARQVTSLGAAQLVLIDHSENALFWIDRELESSATATPVRSVLGSISDRRLVDGTVRRYRPDIVFHAAACKHVAMVEANPIEAIRTNVLGTQSVLRACQTTGVGRFVLVSTDKATNPVNLLGLTKRFAEWVTADAAAAGGRFVSARFGNVLASSGSVYRVFRDQLARGEPLEVRHPDAERHFLTREEAGRLLVLVAHLASGGETFVLKVGEPVGILDLAKRFLQQSGNETDVPGPSDGDMGIRISQLGDGEKLCEDWPEPPLLEETRFPGVTVLRDDNIQSARMDDIMTTLRLACDRNDVEMAMEAMQIGVVSPN